MDAIRVRGIVSFNDGDVCNAACMERLLAGAEATAAAVGSTTKPICVDIGVDRGWWSAFCLTYAPSAHVYAFEPNPLSFSALQTQFATDISGGRLTLIPKAVSASTTTTLPLWLDGGCSHSREAVAAATAAKPTIVSTTTLDFLFDQHPRISCMKIDTEGHEYSIFKCLTPHLARVDTLLFECTANWYGTTPQECLSRTYEMLCSVLTEFPYVYTLSRRGPPTLMRIESEEHAFQLVHQWYINKFQTDILATRTTLESA